MNDDENHTIFYLDDFQINTALSEAVTRLHIAAGTDIIINDEYVGAAGDDGDRFSAR